MKQIFHNVFKDRQKLFTFSKYGTPVYKEQVIKFKKGFLRRWDPFRSKLGAGILNGLKKMPISSDSGVLYLGCAQGTTPSHVSDIADKGFVIGVDISQKTMESFIPLCERRDNMIPILGDANNPDDYAEYFEDIDVVYQDVAQQFQAKIFLKNMARIKSGWGVLVIKSRSVDVTKDPAKVFRKEISVLEKDVKIIEVLELEPFEKDHAMVICKKR